MASPSVRYPRPRLDSLESAPAFLRPRARPPGPRRRSSPEYGTTRGHRGESMRPAQCKGSPAVAALDIHVRQELNVQGDLPGPVACGTTQRTRVVGESAGLEPSRLRFLRAQRLAQLVQQHRGHGRTNTTPMGVASIRLTRRSWRHPRRARAPAASHPPGARSRNQRLQHVVLPGAATPVTAVREPTCIQCQAALCICEVGGAPRLSTSASPDPLPTARSTRTQPSHVRADARSGAQEASSMTPGR